MDCLDELFVTIQGWQQYLWHAADQDGDVIDILVQSRRDRWAAADQLDSAARRTGHLSQDTA